uniref:Uncharacterized protein n=2 Tax=Meloidogyne TaxID=189290 RepID=A0A914L7E8_MELIC
MKRVFLGLTRIVCGSGIDLKKMQRRLKMFTMMECTGIIIKMTRIDDSPNIRRRGKLLDPQQEFGSVRAKLNHILFDEYIGGECSLSTILDWADQMRSSKVEETPLLNLIGRLQMMGQHSLIPPLYNAFLKSFEAKPYANRPEILLPAIANAFQSANPIKEVRLLFNQINSLLQQNKQQGKFF